MTTEPQDQLELVELGFPETWNRRWKTLSTRAAAVDERLNEQARLGWCFEQALYLGDTPAGGPMVMLIWSRANHDEEADA